MSKLLAILLLTALLAACSSSTAPADTTSSAAPASATTNALAGTPMAAYGHDLNKARNVQNVIDQSAAQQAARIDAATGASSGGH
jgi:hypothetical protein